MLAEMSYYLSPEQLAAEESAWRNEPGETVLDKASLWTVRKRSEQVSRFIEAASKGDLGGVIWRIQQGVDVNEADYDGRTALHAAATHGRFMVVSYLLEQRRTLQLSLSPLDRWSRTPLDEAHFTGDAWLIDALESAGAVRSGVHRTRARSIQPPRAYATCPYEVLWAAALGCQGLLRDLTRNGVVVNGSDANGRTPLHLAAAEGQVETARYLVDHGALTEVRDRWGHTPIGEALRNRHFQIGHLLERGQAIA